MKKLLGVIGIMGLPFSLWAGEVAIGEDYTLNAKGNVGVEFWYFPEVEEPEGVTSLFGELDLTFRPKERWEIRANPRVLLDFEDKNRSRIRPPLFDDLYFNYFTNTFEVRAGYQIVSWKTVESYSPADFFNQTDREEDLLDPEKLGELAVRARYIINLNREYVFEMYVIPLHRPAMLPRSTNQYYFLQNPYQISNHGDDHVYLNDLGKWMPQGAIRFQSTYFDFLDLSFFYFFGYDRFPGLIEDGDVSGDKVVHEYRPIMKSGITYQGDVGSWLVKGEGVVNLFPEQATILAPNQAGGLNNTSLSVDPYLAYNLGFEYTLYSFIKDDQDVGLIAEIIGDTDFNKEPFEIETFRPFRSHVFGGFRYSWNSISDRSFLIGGLYNYWTMIENQETELFYQAEFQERIMKHLVLKLRFADIFVSETGNALKSFEDKMRLDAEALVSF